MRKKHLRYHQRKRRTVYLWIRDLAIDLSEAAGEDVIGAVAWRIAAKKWLVQKKLITILSAGKSVIPFSIKSVT